MNQTFFFYLTKKLRNIYKLNASVKGVCLWSIVLLLELCPKALWAQSCDCDYTIPLGTTVVDRNTLSVSVMPKDKRVLCFQSGTRTLPLMLKNFKGSTDGGVNAPYVIKNCSGKVTFNIPLTNGYAFKLYNCENVNISGTGSSDKYGILLNGAHITLVLGDTTSRVEVNNVEIRNSGFCGLMAKTDNALINVPGGNNNPSAYVMRGLYIHDNYIADTEAEGIYIGNTNWAPGNSQHNLDSVFVYDNIIKDSGAEAIQVGGTASGTGFIYNNQIDGFGRKYQSFAQFQNNGIQLSTGFSGRCYNNFIYAYPADEYTQNGIVCVGLGNIYIYNNVIANPKDNGIYIGSNNAESKSKPFYVMNNTIVNPAHDGIRIQEVGSATNRLSVYVYNNLGANIPSGYALVKKNGSLITSSEQANISNLIAAFNFQDPINLDFSLTSNSSLVIDKGTDLVASYGVTQDILGAERSGQGTTFDVGAYELVSQSFSLSIDPIVVENRCLGDTIVINVNGTVEGLPSDVTFNAVLSGPDGYFGSQKVVLGSVDTIPGQITAIFPPHLAPGHTYRARIEVVNNSGFFKACADSTVTFIGTGALKFSAFKRVSVPNAAFYNPGSGNFTIETRIKMDAASEDNGVLEILSTRASGNTSNGYLFGFNYVTQKLFFSFYDGSGNTITLESNTLSLSELRGDGEWYHVGVSRNGGNRFTFYLDGYAVGEKVYNANLSAATASLYIGYDPGTGAGVSSFTGSMDYLRIWNVARTEVQLLDNIAKSFPYSTVGLLGSWNFSECIGSQYVMCDSPYGNHGWLGESYNVSYEDPGRESGPGDAVNLFGLTFNPDQTGRLDVTTIPHHASYNFQGGFSIEAEIELSNPLWGTRAVLYEKDTINGVRFYVVDANRLGLTVGNKTVISEIAKKNNNNIDFYSGECYAVAVSATKSGSAFVVRFYLDGNIIGYSKYLSGQNVINTSKPILIGCDEQQSIPLKGDIREIKLWDVARTGVEIKRDLGVIFSSSTQNLVGYWRLKEKNGQTIIDQSGNDNPGYLGESIAVESSADPIRSADVCHDNARIEAFSSEDSDYLQENNIQVYPNPFANEVGIVINKAGDEVSEIALFDLTGKLIVRESGVKNNQVFVLSPEIPAGIYLIKVVSGEHIEYVKIIKNQ